MATTKKDIIWSVLLWATIVLSLPVVAASAADKADADENNNTSAAVVVDLDGEAWLVRQNESARSALTEGEVLYPGDYIATAADGKVGLLLADETLLRLHYNSEFRLNSAAPVAGWLTQTKSLLKSSYELLKGELWFRNKRRKADIEVSTSHLSISVRGTEFTVIAQADQTLVNMLEGEVSASNGYGSVNAVSGEQVVGQPGKAPFKRILLNPDDAVQWTIRVPAIFDSPGSDTSSAKVLGPLFVQARQAFEAGQIRESYRQAQQITANYPDNVSGWQLFALTALVTNNNDTSLNASIKATQLAPDSAESWLLNSYALQSKFRLGEAADAARTATEKNNRFVQGWLQRAALAVANGNYRKARRYALKAGEVSQGPIADVQSTLGFIALAKGDSKGAQQYFSKALNIDASFASAHVGEALAAMRVNNSEEALKSIATAVAIEPSNASYMNYYAKILYEVGRIERAVEVLARAAELDPNDPTPLYLQAIIERDRHRDLAAIKLLGRAEELNDNKAVYRSKQLLDADRAVKGVDLTLAFDPFQFNSWASYRARRAVESDAQNYSAHIMFADSLGDRKVSRLAVASEATKALYLAPATANTFDSPNDYSNLFEQDDFGGVVNASAASFDTFVTGVTLSNVSALERVAGFITAVYKKSGGYTGTFDDRDKRAELIIKQDVDYNSGWIFSLGTIETSSKDDQRLRTQFNAVSEPRDERQTSEYDARLAYRIKTDESNTLIAQLGYVTTDFEQYDFTRVIDFPGTPFESLNDSVVYNESDTERWLAMLDWNYSGDSLALGAGVINLISEQSVEEQRSPVTGGMFNFDTLQLGEFDTVTRSQFHSGYLNVIARLGRHVSLDGALHAEYFQLPNARFDVDWDEFELNPRLGLVLRDFLGLDFRLLFARYVYAPLPDRIDRIEHAGIEMFQGELGNHLVEESRFVMEHEYREGYWSLSGFYAEDELEFRETVAELDTNSLVIQRGYFALNEYRRSGGSASWNQFLTNRLGLGIDYRYLRVDGNQFLSSRITTDPDLPLSNSRIDQSVATSLAYASSLGVTFRATHNYRKLNFRSDSPNQDDEFDNLDVDLEIELPKKRGLLRVELNNVLDEQYNYFTDQYVSGNFVPARNFAITLDYNL